MKKLLQTWLPWHSHLARSATFSLFVKGGSILLAFLASLLYARSLGTHGYGIYAYTMAWVGILTLLGSLGIPSFVIRELARWPKVGAALFHWGQGWLWKGGVLAAVILLAAACVPTLGQARVVFVWAAPLPLILNLLNLRMGLLLGQERYIAGQWPSALLSPLCVLLGASVLFEMKGTLRPQELIMLTLVGSVIALGIQHHLWKRSGAVRKTVLPEPETPSRFALRQTLPFMWASVLAIVLSRTDLILLGTLAGPRAAGIYAIAQRASELVPFFLSISGTLLAPRLAAFSANNPLERSKAQNLVTAASRRAFALTALPALALAFTAHWLLGLLYGPEFMFGATAMQWLIGAQCLNVFLGPADTVLSMLGHEKKVTLYLGWTVLGNILLALPLIPLLGLNGAALSSAIAIVGSKVFMARKVYLITGIKTLPVCWDGPKKKAP